MVTSKSGSLACSPASIRLIWPGGELLGSGAERVADPVQRVMFAASVAEFWDAIAPLLADLADDPAWRSVPWWSWCGGSALNTPPGFKALSAAPNAITACLAR